MPIFFLVLIQSHTSEHLLFPGGRFRQRCRMNPALINCCTIDWYDEWDKEAMLSVADVFFENAEFIADEDTDMQVSANTVLYYSCDYNYSTCVCVRTVVDACGYILKIANINQWQIMCGQKKNNHIFTRFIDKMLQKVLKLVDRQADG